MFTIDISVNSGCRLRRGCKLGLNYDRMKLSPLLQQFGSGYPGPNCGRSITITAEGKSATATIVDEVCSTIAAFTIILENLSSLPFQCPGCPDGGLDLTEGLFSYFADPSVGVLTGSWTYNN